MAMMNPLHMKMNISTKTCLVHVIFLTVTAVKKKQRRSQVRYTEKS